MTGLIVFIVFICIGVYFFLKSKEIAEQKKRDIAFKRRIEAESNKEEPTDTKKLNKFEYEPDSEIWPFEKKQLLTPSEKKFFELLKTALPNESIYIQVPLSQMMRVKKGHDFKMWNNRINRMSVDFVICDQETNIIAAIELDDKSHDNPKRQADDAKKDKALTCANIKIIRWRVESMPSAEIIREKVLNQDVNV